MILRENYLKFSLIDISKFGFDEKFVLLYRGSRDGFVSSSFHSKCDGYTKTITIIQSSNSNIFGGYTEAIWNASSKQYSYDNKAFLFSIVNSKNKPIMIKPHEFQQAIYVDSQHMPVFGGAKNNNNNYNRQSSNINDPTQSDIMLVDNCNQNHKSFSNLGTSYDYNKVDSKTFLAGSEYFKVNEIEVYWRLP